MGGRGTSSPRAGRALAAARVLCAEGGTLSASVVWLQLLGLLLCLAGTLWCMLHGPVVPVTPLPERRGAGREDRTAPREPAALQWDCVHNWSLYNARGRGLLICNLKCGSAKLRRHLVQQRYTHAPLDVLMTLPISSKLRDQLGMVVYPGQAGSTVTRGCVGLNWLGGERMGDGRFATSREICSNSATSLRHSTERFHSSSVVGSHCSVRARRKTWCRNGSQFADTC